MESFLPKGVDPAKLETITLDAINEYYENIYEYYGPFCQLCQHFDQEVDWCKKDHRPRKKLLDIGPYGYVHLRKWCEDHILKDGEMNTEQLAEDIKRKIGHALDSSYQQYC